jgi:4-hydroxyphenylpyruvate dioxygenase
MAEERNLFSRFRNFNATLEEVDVPPPTSSTFRSGITLTTECRQDVHLAWMRYSDLPLVLNQLDSYRLDMPHKPAISSMSLGRASVHDFTKKMNEAIRHGFRAIELFFEDLQTYAVQTFGDDSKFNQTKAAYDIRAICGVRKIKIMCLQPFLNYEGLRDRVAHKAAINNMSHWIKLAQILDTDLISIPSSFLPEDEINGEIDTIVKDLIEVAELGEAVSPPIRFAYKSLAWGTYINTWQQCWDIVKRVNKPNFGICLDTFNIAARIYADPTAKSGKLLDADAAIKASMEELVKTVDVKKIFYVQVVDAEKLEHPLVPGHPFYSPSQPARMSWSKNCRLFYGEREFEKEPYLPIDVICNAIFRRLKYEGWISQELFNRCMADPDPEMPRKLAFRATISTGKLVRAFKLRIESQDIGTEAEDARL